ncbi:MAG: WYL domain-containing protein [Candidatus Onthovivens sp.]|nr:WYL domain-containing protein [Candidatus Onthovivens sp.]
MAFKGNKKIVILYILKILKEYSDENHVLSDNTIVSKLKEEYNIDYSRQSIISNIKTLKEGGYEIVTSNNGSYLSNRVLDEDEIFYLVDSLFSNNKLDCQKAKELTSKLFKELNIHSKNNYECVYKPNNSLKIDIKQFNENLESINNAILKKKQIQFKYKGHGINSNGVKGENLSYVVNPYMIINNQGKYILVCNKVCFDNLSNFDVDLITDVTLRDTKIKPQTEVKGYENGIDIDKYLNDIADKSNGEIIKVEVKLQNKNIKNIIEQRFGNNASFSTRNNNQYAEISYYEKIVLRWLLEYADVIEVIKPFDLRDKFKKKLSLILEKYK